MSTKRQRQSTPMKQSKPQKATAQVTPYDNRWVASLQFPGSFQIFSKSFDTEEEALRHATEFLAQFVTREDNKRESTVKTRKLEVFLPKPDQEA